MRPCQHAQIIVVYFPTLLSLSSSPIDVVNATWQTIRMLTFFFYFNRILFSYCQRIYVFLTYCNSVFKHSTNTYTHTYTYAIYTWALFHTHILALSLTIVWKVLICVFYLYIIYIIYTYISMCTCIFYSHHNCRYFLIWCAK